MRYSEEEKQIVDSLKVSSHLDSVYNKLVHGTPISGDSVPNYGELNGLSNENSSLFSFDPSKNDNLFKISSQVVGVPTIVAGFNESISQPQTMEKQSSKPKMSISKNQAIALSKWPSLIEVLGTSYGEKIAKEILVKLNEVIIDKIVKNTQQHNKFIYAGQNEKSNMKFFYKSENDSWICCVTASGPFRGDEIVYYSPDDDEVSILRMADKEFYDVSEEFNVVHESAQKGE